MFPLIHSMYLTDKHFSDVRGSFTNTKRAILELLNVIQRSQQRPMDIGPQASIVVERMNAEAGNNGPDIEGMMREIILKFLRETPLQILKGIIELIESSCGPE